MSKSRRLNIEDLKSEFLNKEFGWLTVIDIIRDSGFKCVCKCRCGNEKIVNIYKLRSGHTKSCGCYSKSDEFSNNQRQYLLDHPEIIQSNIDKYSAWRNSCKDEVELANEKHKQWFKDNPDKVADKAAKYSQWCKDNPDQVKEKTEKYLNWCDSNHEALVIKGKRHSKWHEDHKAEFSNIRKQHFIDHPEDKFTLRDYLVSHLEIRSDNGKKRSQWYKDHPDETVNIGKSISKYFSDHKDETIARANKVSQYYKDNPDKAKEVGKRVSQWCKDHPEEVAVKAANYSVWYANNNDKTLLMQQHRRETIENNPEIMLRVAQQLKQRYIDNPEERKVSSDRARAWYDENTDHSYLEAYKDIIHPDDYNYALSHPISHIRIKCPVCGEYAAHSFSNVFVSARQSLKYNRAPMCLDCKCAATTSYAEIEIANFISTFYNGTLIRNSRDIISPLEIDLYYPDKKIAIEFNGDYWHSDKFKDRYYHLNKYIMCCSKRIRLISIFEKDWNDRKELVKQVIQNAFANITPISNEDAVSIDCDFYSIADYLGSGYKLEHIDEVSYNFCGHTVYRTGNAHLVKS